MSFTNVIRNCGYKCDILHYTNTKEKMFKVIFVGFMAPRKVEADTQ
jgi:hypothetical protein